MFQQLAKELAATVWGKVALVSPDAAEWSWVSLFFLNLVLDRAAEVYRRRRGAPAS